MAEAPNLKPQVKDLAAREEAVLLRARIAQRKEFERLSHRRAQSARINRERAIHMTPAEYEASLIERRLKGR